MSPSGACTGGITAYSWDAQDQLIRIDFPGGGFAAYAYDALGRRIQKDVGGTTTKYLYDGEDIALEFDVFDALQARYSHGDGRDEPLVMERGGQPYFYHTDHLGSVRLVTDSIGSVVNAYDYDAFGNFEVRSEAVTNPYTFTGREYDAESGLYYYRARYYDSNTGRFLNEDSLGFAAGDANLYRYVFSNPVKFGDPSGNILVCPECVSTALDALRDFAFPRFCPVPPGQTDDDLLNGPIPGQTVQSEAKSGDETSSGDTIGENRKPGSGNRVNTDLPGGKEAAQDVFDDFAEGDIDVDPKTGDAVAENDVRMRTGDDGRVRVDIPAGVGTAGVHETIHFND